MSDPRQSRARVVTVRHLDKNTLRLGPVPKLVAFGYALLGVCASANDKYEVFPFFSWFLFPLTPNRVVRYELTPMPRLSELGRLHRMDLYVLTQELGARVEQDDRVAISQLRLRLEYNFLEPPCRYTLARTEYEPTARWTRGTSLTWQGLGEFTCRQGP